MAAVSARRHAVSNMIPKGVTGFDVEYVAVGQK